MDVRRLERQFQVPANDIRAVFLPHEPPDSEQPVSAVNRREIQWSVVIEADGIAACDPQFDGTGGHG